MFQIIVVFDLKVRKWNIGKQLPHAFVKTVLWLNFTCCEKTYSLKHFKKSFFQVVSRWTEVRCIYLKSALTNEAEMSWKVSKLTESFPDSWLCASWKRWQRGRGWKKPKRNMGLLSQWFCFYNVDSVNISRSQTTSFMSSVMTEFCWKSVFLMSAGIHVD